MFPNAKRSTTDKPKPVPAKPSFASIVKQVPNSPRDPNKQKTGEFFAGEKSKPNVSNKSEDFTKAKEGLKLNAYDDGAGNLTIGYGHLITEEEKKTGTIKLTNGESVRFSKGESLTESQAERLYIDDKERHTTAGLNILGSLGVKVDQLNDSTRNALADLAYNAGPEIFKKTPKLVQALKNNDLLTASKEMRDIGLKSTSGKYLPGLRTRANERSNQILSSITPAKNGLGKMIASEGSPNKSQSPIVNAPTINNVTNVVKGSEGQQSSTSAILPTRSNDSTYKRAQTSASGYGVL